METVPSSPCCSLTASSLNGSANSSEKRRRGGGTFEKETEGSGVLEAEDVKCKGSNYDFRLTKDYKVFAIVD